MNPMLYLLSTTCTYACFTFQIFGWKSRMGTRLLEFGEIRLVINQSVVLVELEYSPEDRSCLFRCLYSEVIFFILIRYVFKHYILILPLFVAICDIWLPRLTYGVYLVLFLKPGATVELSLNTHLILGSTPHTTFLYSFTLVVFWS